ncbi:unnamed protein product [Adineta ricciae]|uniref:Nuclear receptor domain-containing protein n=1 Tax=Adineta ricciae TaxID=249248 RepID=A0A813T4L3_ADIRI|nr:unnamed protein product [Adineta ricciae]
MNSTVEQYHRQSSYSTRECIICNSKAIGINFGAPTCAPCKAFFRRNARRKEILNLPCQHLESNVSKKSMDETNDATSHYMHIRRCSSCRLQRCFEVGMKEELVRTDEENERHRKLVDNNRKRRLFLKQQQESRDDKSIICQRVLHSGSLLNELDWQHLSNVVYAYDTCCLKAFIERRATLFPTEMHEKRSIAEYSTLVPFNLVLSVSSFVRALPAFHSLSRNEQIAVCRNNLRRLMLINSYELNQSCFSERWQSDVHQASWQYLCGSELYKELAYSEQLAEKTWIADPIVTRVWIIVIFFSTPLFCYYDSKSSVSRLKKTSPLFDRQNAYVTLLWKYLLHRHGDIESVRIYSNLMRVYLNMLRAGLLVNIHVRSHRDLLPAHETLDQAAILDTNSNSERK